MKLKNLRILVLGALMVGLSGAAHATSPLVNELRKGFHGTFEGRLYGEDLTIKVLRSGKLVGRYGDDKDTGVWRIFDNGMLCLKWNNWLNAAKRCGRLESEDGRYRIMGISLKKND